MFLNAINEYAYTDSGGLPEDGHHIFILNPNPNVQIKAGRYGENQISWYFDQIPRYWYRNNVVVLTFGAFHKIFPQWDFW